jgi:excisionase family DNA binding protein
MTTGATDRNEVADHSGLLTKEGLALALKVSVSTVERMVADGEIIPVKPRGTLVRFYLPDVVRQLTANALTSKRGCARRIAAEPSRLNSQQPVKLPASKKPCGVGRE